MDTGGTVGVVLLNGDIEPCGLTQIVFEWVTAVTGHLILVLHDSGGANTSHVVCTTAASPVPSLPPRQFCTTKA